MKKKQTTQHISRETPIDVKRLIDELATGAKKFEQLTAKEARVVIDTRHIQHALVIDEMKRTNAKCRVGKAFKWLPHAMAGVESAEATINSNVNMWATYAGTGQKSSKGFESRKDFSHQADFQRAFAIRKAQIKTCADVLKFPELACYLNNHGYTTATIRRWINAIAPGHLQWGRPKKV
jgi:hypothetical protein